MDLVLFERVCEIRYISGWTSEVLGNFFRRMSREFPGFGLHHRLEFEEDVDGGRYNVGASFRFYHPERGLWVLLGREFLAVNEFLECSGEEGFCGEVEDIFSFWQECCDFREVGRFLWRCIYKLEVEGEVELGRYFRFIPVVPRGWGYGMGRFELRSQFDVGDSSGLEVGLRFFPREGGGEFVFDVRYWREGLVLPLVWGELFQRAQGLVEEVVSVCVVGGRGDGD